MCVLKVCGVTRLEDAAAAARLGYRAVGMVFAESPRRVDPDLGRAISSSLPSTMLRVGVFVNEDRREVERIATYCHLDLVQLHGDESPREASYFGPRAIKALRPRSREELAMLEEYSGIFAILLDAWDPALRGGTGREADWDLAAEAAGRARVILAGGLGPANVGRAVRKVRPYGVDTASGVEASPGVKDHGLMAEFALRARDAATTAAEEKEEGAHAQA